MKTPAEAKADIQKQGITIAEWSRARGFTLPAVYQILAGKCKGRYGESHRIAKALGLVE